MERQGGVRQVIDPATWDRAALFRGMRDQALELIETGVDTDRLTRFEASANQWLANQGVHDPACPFRVVGTEDDGATRH